MPQTNRVEDINGWYEVKANPLSKAGVFDYLGASIDFDGAMGLERDKIYKVYRPAEELSSVECTDSFKLLPWINDHEMLGSEFGTTPAEEKGVEGVIGETVFFDSSDGMLKGNIKIFSEDLKRDVEFGKKELSCGYRCEYEKKDGVFNGDKYDIIQKNIRGNHLALVDKGRMGSDVAVMDSKNFITIDSVDLIMPIEIKKETEEAKVVVSLDDVMVKLTGVEDSIKSVSDTVNKQTTGSDTMPEESKIEDEKLDSEVEDKDEDKSKEEDKDDEKGGGNASKAADASEISELRAQVASIAASFDSMKGNAFRAFQKELSAKTELYSKLSVHVGAFDHSEKGLKEVAKYGVEKLGIKCEDGQEVAVLNGFLHNRPAPTSAAMYSLDSATKESAADVTNLLIG
jgi:hypothetical protein